MCGLGVVGVVGVVMLVVLVEGTALWTRCGHAVLVARDGGDRGQGQSLSGGGV